MEIKQQNNEKNGIFEAFIDGNKAGEITYTWAGEGMFIVDHTGVEEGYNGRGVGKEILLNIVDYARKENKKIIPLCPFAKAQFDKNEDLRDVLK